jgi:hypothetical protein
VNIDFILSRIFTFPFTTFCSVHWDFLAEYSCYLCKVISLCLSTSHMRINCLQPNLQSKTQKEGAESDQFWALLGGKSEYPSQKIVRDAESDSHLFSCNFSKGLDN